MAKRSPQTATKPAEWANATAEAMGWHRTMSTWRGMMARCYSSSAAGYKDYGGRGIKVCDRWRDEVYGFKNFAEDMGARPEDKTLDRINVNGDYTPTNCRWSTRQEQSNNKRSKSITERMEGARRNRERAFEERDRLLAIVSTLFPSHLAPSRRKDVSWRYLVCVHLPAGQ